jgi:hypothetical protein
LSIPSPRRESFELRFRRPNRLFESSRVGNMEVMILNELPLSVGAGPRDGMVVYSRDEPARIRYEGLTLKEFFDFRDPCPASGQGYLALVSPFFT